MDIPELQKTSPVFVWSQYLKKINIQKIDSVIIGQPEFLAAVSVELKITPLMDWKNYLRFQRSLGSFVPRTDCT